MASSVLWVAPVAIALGASPALAADGDDDPDREACRRHASLHAVEDCGTIAGRVVTADGAPVPHAGVFVEPAHGGVHDGSGYGVAMRSDGDGRFAFRDLSPSGEWILTLSASAYRESRVKVTTGSLDVVVTAVAR